LKHESKSVAEAIEDGVIPIVVLEGVLGGDDLEEIATRALIMGGGRGYFLIADVVITVVITYIVYWNSYAG